MGLMRRIRGAWRTLFARERAELELNDELQFHIELETGKNIQAGMSPDAARRKAIVDFGGVEATKETHRDVRGGRWIEEAVADARHALRGLRLNPVLAGAAVITLALGIGANTAIFSVVNAVILRPLPFPHPEQLVVLNEDNAEKNWVRNVVAPANYLDWKERVAAFQDVAAYTSGGGSTVAINGEPTRIRVRSVTGNYFAVLGARAGLGRTFEPDETWQRALPPVILSHRLWQDGFGGDRHILGRTVTFDGSPAQVVGVMPASFSFAADTMDAWGTMNWDPQNRSRVFFRRAHWLRVIARLKPGVTPEAADAAFQAVVRQLQTEFPLTNRVMGADLVPLHEYLAGDVRPALLLLQGAVALLLLIACANVGNLLLVRALGREREVSLRLTLGAGRGRLVRQAFTECLVLSALGGAAGFVLGWWGTRTLAALQPNGMLPVANVPMDLSVMLATMGITTLTGLLFGIAPALWSARRSPADVLKEGGRGQTGRGLRRWGSALVVGEVALAMLLTLGAGLLVRSYWRLLAVDPGVATEGVLAIGVRMGTDYDTSNTRQLAFTAQALEKVGAIPGVRAVGAGLQAPFTGTAWTGDYKLFGTGPEEYGTEVAHEQVTPGYFTALGMQLRAGRLITDADQQGAEPVIVINESMARRAFDGRDPVGQRLTFAKYPDSTSVWYTVVGVVADVRQSGLASPTQVTAYESFAQNSNSYITLMIRYSGDPSAVITAVRQAVRAMNPNLALATVRTLDELKARSIARQRFLMLLLGVFAATGFLLSVVGVYGVMAQLARYRTREMGIRLALGAQTSDVQWLVMRHAGKVVGLGLLVGLVTAFAATRGIASLLYDVKPTDPVTFGGVLVLLLLTGLVASWLPAVRVSRTAPASTLRDE